MTENENKTESETAASADKPQGPTEKPAKLAAQKRTAEKPVVSGGDPLPITSDFFLHSFLLLLGRVANRILEFYNSLFSIDSRDTVRIYDNLGRGYRKKGLHDKALAAYRELINLNPKNADAHFHMARIYEAKGEGELAAQMYQLTVEIKPSYAEALYRLGLLQGKSGDFKGAIESISRAVEIAPKKHGWHYRLGIFHDKNGAPEKARDALETAIALNEGNPKYHQYLGFVYEGMGRHSDAIPHFKSVMELEGTIDSEALST